MGCCVSCHPTLRDADVLSYREFERTASTGDLVEFAGRGKISTAVRIGTLSPLDHIGMVVRCPHMRNENEEADPGPYLWHATSVPATAAAESITHTVKSGPQLSRLHDVLRERKGDKFVRRLTTTSDPARRWCTEGLHEFMERRISRPFELFDAEMVAASYDGPLGHNTEDFAKYFCSELIAETYQFMGFLSAPRAGGGGKPANEYVPADFSTLRSGGMDWSVADTVASLAREIRLVPGRRKPAEAGA